MGNDELIDSHVSRAQSQKAVTALLQHVRKAQQQADETELLPAKEQHVWLVLTVRRMQPMKKLKPQRIPLAHPLVDPRTSSVCLVTKDPQREYKDLLEAQGVKFISRVVGLQKLRGKFKGFDARRLLLRENDLFLADDRVLPLLPQLLGKKWFEAKKQPIPVSLTKKALKAELETAISSTYMHQNQGTCTSIKIATTSHKDTQVLANLVTALPAVVSRIDGGWDNVQSLNIKTSDSVSLPIWTCPLGGEEPGSRWDGMMVDENEEWGGIGADAEAGEAGGKEPEPLKSTTKANGKKRAADETEETPSGTKKKAKKTKGTSEDSTSTPIAAAVKHSKDSKSAATPAKESQSTKSSSTKDSVPETVSSPAKESKPAKGTKSRKTPKSATDSTPAKESNPVANPKPTADSTPTQSKATKSKSTAKESKSTPKTKPAQAITTPKEAKPAKSTTPKEPSSTMSTSTPKDSTKKSKKSTPASVEKDLTPTRPPRGGKVDLKSPAPTSELRPKKKKEQFLSAAPVAAEKTLSRTELAEKKGSLENTQLAKKKGKLRDTEKSARKGVKAGLVGRSKA